MKVTLLSTYHLNGGAGVAATRLHRALLKHGYPSSMLVDRATRPEPGVVPLADTYLNKKWATARFALDRLSFVPFEKDRSVRFQFSPARVGAAPDRHTLVQQADLLHLHWTTFGFLSLSGLDRLLRSGKPIVWTLHDMWAFTGGCHYSRGCAHFQIHCQACPYLRRPGPNDLSARIFDRKLAMLKGAPRLHLVAPSEWMAGEVAQSALLRSFPLSVIPNTLDQSIFQPLPRQTAERALGLAPIDGGRLLFGSFNTSDPRKGFAYFEQALGLLKKQHPHLKPEIMVFGKGSGETPAALPYPVRQLGVLSSDEQIVAAYNAADALVVPSLEDNQPNTIVESLSCGTPVVGFRTGGIPGMIRHKQTGYLAEVGSAQQLADGLAFVLAHPDPDGLREQARMFAGQTFAEAAVVQQHTQLYESLVN